MPDRAENDPPPKQTPEQAAKPAPGQDAELAQKQGPAPVQGQGAAPVQGQGAAPVQGQDAAAAGNRGGWTYLNGFWGVVRVTAIVTFAILVIAIGIGLGRYGFDYFKNSNSESARAARDYADVSPAAIQEWQLARADHQAIAAAVASCSNIFDLEAQPRFIRNELRLDTLPDGSQGYLDSKVQPVDGKLTLTNYQRAAIFLSDSITRSRIESATTANLNYSSMFWFQLAIVGIGAITTILISIKSIAPTGNSQMAVRLSLWVGILAIIFSSLGTATSALNSFYGPRESYLKSERSLAGLRQLHSDIAAKIASNTVPNSCPGFDPKDKDDPYGKQVQDWATKLGVILNAADSGSSSSQNPSSTAGTALPKGSAPAPAAP